MLTLFFVKCFLIGISAASALGPVFVLTFNNSALRGFLKGFFTALGAAVGDGLLLFLGLIGALGILQQSQKYHVILDIVGGSLLCGFGILILISPRDISSKISPAMDLSIFMTIKTFLSTILNPLSLLFFMFISAQTFSRQIAELSTWHMAAGSCVAALGSLTILTLIALIASKVGTIISPSRLKFIAWATGIIIIGIGTYFFVDAMKMSYAIWFRGT